MQTKLFLLGLAAALSFSSMQAQEKVYVSDAYKTMKSVTIKKQPLKASLTKAMRLKAVLRADVPDGMAQVTLTAGDLWEDGSGYQMLLDADATAYGTIFQATGGLTTSGSADASVYDQFEYKIPENADGDLSTTNVVINNSITITIPAGTYDYCIANPTAGDRVWIASDEGPDKGRADDFVFEAGYNYVFTLSLFGDNDGVTLTIPVEGQALTVPEALNADPAATSADIAWTDNDDMGWNLRYRPYVDPAFISKLWDLPADQYQSQIQGFVNYDADGDGNNWGVSYSDDTQMDACFFSASYYNYQALTPDNWLVTPAVSLGGTLKFKTWNKSASYPDKIAVYVCPNAEWESVDEFIMLQDNIVPGDDSEDIEIDLSAYEGMGHIAFRHYDSHDQFAIYIDDIEVIVPDAQEVPDWIVVEGLDATNYTIDGLTPETEYEVQVQAVGHFGTSDWTESTLFTTQEFVPEVMRGDVNRDGNVNISDVTALIDMLLTGDNSYSLAADCNRSGNIDISDVTTLIDYLLSGTWTEVEMVYTVVGPESVFGSDWNVNYYNGRMTKGADGIYYWFKNEAELDGDFELKIVGNHNYSLYEWPVGEGNNWVANVPEAGIYDIMITFNPNAAEAERINCVLTKTHVYTVIGTPGAVFGSEDPYDEGNRMEKGDDGIYRKAYEGRYLTEWTDVKFKVIQDCNMEISWPKTEEGYWYTAIPETGVYSFYITFDPNTGEVTCEPKKEVLPDFPE